MPAKGTRGSANNNKMSASDASRIQAAQAKAGADTGKGTFPARAQAAAAKNSTPPTGAKSGKGGAKVA